MPESTRGNARRRLFFALWPDAETREALGALTSAAVERSRGRPVPRANLHLTLAFLGAVDSKQADLLMRSIVVSGPCFEYTLDRLGYAERGRVLWLEPSVVPAALIRLEQDIWRALAEFGFRREQRLYRPHVTLARHARPVDAIAGRVEWRVRGFSLIESVQVEGGSRYTNVRDWLLAG